MTLGLLGATSLAHAQTSDKALEVADCVKVIRADSVHMFFDEKYALTPPACASIRRESRMDAALGVFVGEARDYRQADNALLSKMHYSPDGLRNGLYEQYHQNHQLAVRGEFAQGNPSGAWQFWYPNGQAQQTLEWTGREQPQLRIMAYWNPEGKQEVVDGAGTWQGTTGGFLPARFGGRVANGYQQGNWEARSQRNNDLVTVEKFRDGQLMEGQQYVGGNQQNDKPLLYKNKPSLEPAIDVSSVAAEPLHLGKTCEEQTRSSYELTAGEKLVITAPQPQQDPSSYQKKVLRQLREFNNLTQSMPRTDGQAVVVTADIDAKGQVHNFASSENVIAAAFASFVPSLGAWQPATAVGVPVPGKAKFTLVMHSTQIRCQLQTAVAYPLPMEVLKNFKKR
ncbi:hypothetical protein [Hymenobacter sp.]|jgi:antitoxin component YwqK of YwqJK toxin-antitoxin module|uniref:toxin-antitoxin system YwqK family antitoxin n=1 Tax=Hymenobacter sp. TaxID=1898978 RepID=UPI002ED80D17